MRAKRTPGKVGRPAGRSGLPAPIPGEPFSLIGTLRRTTRPLTVKDAAELLLISENAVYQLIKRGIIPVLDLGFGSTRIDPKAWAERLEHKNPHLVASAKRSLQAA